MTGFFSPTPSGPPSRIDPVRVDVEHVGHEFDSQTRVSRLGDFRASLTADEPFPRGRPTTSPAAPLCSTAQRRERGRNEEGMP